MRHARIRRRRARSGSPRRYVATSSSAAPATARCSWLSRSSRGMCLRRLYHSVAASGARRARSASGLCRFFTIRPRVGRGLTFWRGGAHTRRREAALRQGETPQKPRSGGVRERIAALRPAAFARGGYCASLRLRGGDTRTGACWAAGNLTCAARWSQALSDGLRRGYARRHC
jgi:hypothetical protein